MSTTIELDDALRSSGLLTVEELERVEILARSRCIPLPRAAVALGLMAEDQFLWLAADSAGMELLSPTEDGVDAALVHRVPLEELQRHTALPITEDEDEAVVIAFAEPPSNALLARFSNYFRAPVRPMLASAPRLRRILGRIEGAHGESPWRAASQDPTGVTAFYRHLTSGLSIGASEIRFEPGPSELRVRYRRNGALRHVESEPTEIAPAVASRARMVAGLEPPEFPIAQTAIRRMKLGGNSVRFEVSIVPVRDGELVIVRSMPWVDLPRELGNWPLFGEAASWVQRDFVTPGGAKGWLRVHADDLELRDAFVRSVAMQASENGLAVAWQGPDAPDGPWTRVCAPGAVVAARPDLLVVDAQDDLFALEAPEGFPSSLRIVVAGRLPRSARAVIDPQNFVAEVTVTSRRVARGEHSVSASVSSLRDGGA